MHHTALRHAVQKEGETRLGVRDCNNFINVLGERLYFRGLTGVVHRAKEMFPYELVISNRRVEGRDVEVGVHLDPVRELLLGQMSLLSRGAVQVVFLLRGLPRQLQARLWLHLPDLLEDLDERWELADEGAVVPEEILSLQAVDLAELLVDVHDQKAKKDACDGAALLSSFLASNCISVGQHELRV